MLVKSILGHKNILKFCGHTSADFTIKMRFFEMLNSLFVIIEVDIFKLFRVFVTNKAFLMCMLEMSSELINVIESLFTKSACWV